MTIGKPAYPLDAWRIRETDFDPALLARNETTFALSNGNLGLRGNFEEGTPVGTNGTYINGFYEETPIVYGEIAYGYARKRQVMLNVADGKRIALWVSKEPLDLSRGTILSYERALDLSCGLLVRSLRWRSPAGREIEEWRRAASRMHIPVDAATGIHAQDDSFLDRAPWDFARTPPENRPLMMHYHPLVLYRHQVLKQPDVVLAQVLLGSRFSMAEKKRNFDFYDPLTTGDSSLSPCIQSVAAAQIGYTGRAYAYFCRTARMDLDDVNGNVEDGVHTAAMAGTWMSVVWGFAGMRDYGGSLSFAPRLPREWKRLRFRLRVRGRLVDVSVAHDGATYLLLEGEPLSIRHRGRAVLVSLTPALSCVIFDLDGVLTDTAELHFQAWKRLADEIRVPFDRGVNERLKGVGRSESLDIILQSAGVQEDAEVKRDLAERKNSYCGNLLEAITPADLLPGMTALLAALRSRGIKTALASGSRNARQVIRRLGIGALLEHIVDAADVLKGKPDPEIFFRAAEGLGVPFENCAAVE